MKCLNCGNNNAFYEAYKAWDKVYYNGGLTPDDAKSMDVEPCDDPRECADCGSTDVSEVLC